MRLLKYVKQQFDYHISHEKLLLSLNLLENTVTEKRVKSMKYFQSLAKGVWHWTMPALFEGPGFIQIFGSKIQDFFQKIFPKQ